MAHRGGNRLIRLRRPRSAQRGATALLVGLGFAVIFTIFLMVATTYSQTSVRQTKHTKYHTQAVNVAQAGLTDASNWFRRQRVQPVLAFDPLVSEVGGEGQSQDPWALDPGGPGAGKEHLGIVKEMEFDHEANLWARYEVGKITRFEEGTGGGAYWVMEEDTTTPGTWVKKTIDDADADRWEGVQDVSANYGIDVPGTIWRVRSQAYIYRRDPKAAPGTPFYQWPNQVLGTAEAEVELNRMGVPMLGAATIGADGQWIRFGHPPYNDDNLLNIRIIAPDGAIAAHGGGNPKPPAPKPPFHGAKVDYSKNNPDMSPQALFGVPDLNALVQMADKLYTSVADLPPKIDGFIYLKPTSGTAVFNAARPLNGSGILVCEGNLIIERGSNSTYGGFLYVIGDYEQNSVSTLVGSVAVWDPNGNNNKISVIGDECCTTIEYDEDLLQEIMNRIGGYRERKVALRPLE